MHVNGKVVDATTRAALIGARVVLEVGGRTVAINADGDGRFDWRDDALGGAGTLHYEIEQPGYAPVSGDREMRQGEAELLIALRPRTATVRFSVHDEDGGGVVGAEVRLLHDGQDVAEGRTDPRGEVELGVSGEPARAELRYRVAHADHTVAEGTVSLAATDGAVRVDVTLKDAGRSQPTNPFEAVRAHPRYAELVEERPSARRLYGRNVAGIVFGTLFAGMGVLWIAMAAGSGGPGFVALIALVPMAIGAGIVLYGVAGSIKLAGTPLVVMPARIVAKRTSVSGGGQRSATTYYYVTIELEDGDRNEHSVAGDLYGMAADGDLGVAYVRGTDMLDFQRVATGD